VKNAHRVKLESPALTAMQVNIVVATMTQQHVLTVRLDSTRTKWVHPFAFYVTLVNLEVVPMRLLAFRVK